MTTDWILIHRAAAELERALAGGRVVDVGLLDDGRIGVRFALRQAQGDKVGAQGDKVGAQGDEVGAQGDKVGAQGDKVGAQGDKVGAQGDKVGARGDKGGAGRTLAIDAFASPPMVTLDDAELAVGVDPGWLRSVTTTLRGMRLTAVRTRPGDRVLVFAFGTASRFGVETASRLVVELVPRYGNVALLRDRVVVAAAKQFSPAENEARSVQVGLPYEAPPLPVAALDWAGFAAALEGAADDSARARALGGHLPELPRLLAASLVADSLELAELPAAAQAAMLDESARALLAESERAAGEQRDLHLYRDDAGAIVAAHVVPLAQYATLTHARVGSLLEVFAEARARTLRARSGDATERRRASLLARIEKRARATDGEIAAVAARIVDDAARDRLRESGDALFTYGHAIAAGATAYVPPSDAALTIELDPELDAKENAQRYYARYRKAADALPHLERRREALAARRGALDVLAFEVERADSPTIPELEADLDALEGRPPQRATVAAGRRRPPLRLERPSGARIYVGRSPRENAEVTFRIAKPDDLWFHARGIPGSHVVLQAPPGRDPDDDDLDAAADLAATHSKARHAPRVEIDYTERKHVRKQRDGAPGLVWYTNARTRVGHPATDP